MKNEIPGQRVEAAKTAPKIRRLPRIGPTYIRAGANGSRVTATSSTIAGG